MTTRKRHEHHEAPPAAPPPAADPAPEAAPLPGTPGYYTAAAPAAPAAPWAAWLGTEKPRDGWPGGVVAAKAVVPEPVVATTP